MQAGQLSDAASIKVLVQEGAPYILELLRAQACLSLDLLVSFDELDAVILGAWLLTRERDISREAIMVLLHDLFMKLLESLLILVPVLKLLDALTDSSGYLVRLPCLPTEVAMNHGC